MSAGKGKGFSPDNVLCRNCQRSGSPSIWKYLDQDKIMAVGLSALKGKAASYLTLALQMFTRTNFQELKYSRVAIRQQ